MTPGPVRAARAACLAFCLWAWAGSTVAQITGTWPPPPPPPAPPVDGGPSGGASAVPPASPSAAPSVEREPVAYALATVQTLDKITGRVRQLDIEVDQTQRAGAIAVTVRACRGRPDDDPPDSAAFLEVNEVTGEDGALRRLFTGWMFASTPAASALEHRVYDVWLVACRTSSRGSSR